MTRAYAIVKRQRNPCSARRDHGHLGETSSVKVAGTGSLGRPGRAENPPAWVSAKWAPHRPTAGPETGRARRSVNGPPGGGDLVDLWPKWRIPSTAARLEPVARGYPDRKLFQSEAITWTG